MSCRRLCSLALTLVVAGCYASARESKRDGAPQPQSAYGVGLAADSGLSQMSPVEYQIFQATNHFREAHGLRKLIADPVLTPFARSRSQDMARRHYFSHTTPDGRGVFDLMEAAGIDYSRAAENIHMSSGLRDLAKVAEKAVNGWINSEGHRKNMLSRDLTHIGIGVAQGPDGAYYSTQVFRTP